MTALKKIALCVLLTLPAVARAEDPTPDAAEKAFSAGDFEKARQIYKSLLTHDGSRALPPAFFYDYGTAAAKAGATGEAFVALAHASYAMPFDSDVKHNLRMVEAQIPATTRAIQPAAWYSWWPDGLRVIPVKVWLLLGLALTAGALFTVRVADRAIPVGLGATALALLLFGICAAVQARLPVYGVVALAKVKSGPGNSFTDITSLEPGSLVNEETVRDGWLKIRFLKAGADEETVGWIEPTSVLPVY